MTPRDAVLKVELKKADVVGRVAGDVVLQRSELVTLLGRRFDDVARAGSARRAADRATLFQQGEAGDSLVFILSGSVRLVGRRDADAVELGLVHRGDVVGEFEVLDGKGPRQVTAVATGVVEFVDLSRASLLDAAGKLPQALERFLAARRAERRKALDDMTDFLNRW
ncbi:MAG: cyclic nucleotide-binding domain-containing protein [Myxococcaceae bacterium]|jgi:CRP-like cAMP-binding protein|nr:cyclic nucleotide-binding domain-containing protein [Myxococcaceae bacterium]